LKLTFVPKYLPKEKKRHNKNTTFFIKNLTLYIHFHYLCNYLFFSFNHSHNNRNKGKELYLFSLLLTYNIIEQHVLWFITFNKERDLFIHIIRMIKITRPYYSTVFLSINMAILTKDIQIYRYTRVTMYIGGYQNF
jgi:hypothetical protein